MKNTPLMAFFFIVLLVFFVAYWPDEEPKERPQPTAATCECLNYYQWQYFSTKRDRIINKMYGAKKSKREPLQDSLKKINIILGIEETLDNPPKR